MATQLAQTKRQVVRQLPGKVGDRGQRGRVAEEAGAGQARLQVVQLKGGAGVERSQAQRQAEGGGEAVHRGSFVKRG